MNFNSASGRSDTVSQRIFLGKFTKKFDDQIDGRYYAAGDQGNPWYGEVELGDKVFIAYEGKIIALWKAREYAKVRPVSYTHLTLPTTPYV